MNWNSISKEQLNLAFLEEYGEQINWNIISSQGGLSEEIIHAFAHKINWELLCGAQPLSSNIINTFADHIRWDALSKSPFLSDSHITTYKTKLNWRFVSQTQFFSFPSVVSHIDTIYIPMLNKNENTFLTEEEWESVKQLKFEHFQTNLTKNTVEWGNVTFDTYLPMELLEKYAKQIDWRGVAIFQDISFPFIEKHMDKIDPTLLRINPHLSLNRNQWQYLENIATKKTL